jgi:osmotically inducible protein OsmC
MKRNVNAIWNGDGIDGNGFLTAQSGAFHKMPYSFKTRFENDNGELGTNPEELIASALAGCFNMKLAFVLNEANFNPTELNTNATLTFVDGSVISIELILKGKVPDLNEEKFIEFAEEAKKNCPISGVLNCEIILNASLV